MKVPVTVEDVSRRLPCGVSPDDEGRAEALLEEAWLLVTDLMGTDYSDGETVPDKVRLVVARMASRALQRPAQLSGAESWQEQWGPFMGSVRFGANANDGGVWLTAQDKRLLLGGSGTAAVSVPMVSARFA